MDSASSLQHLLEQGFGKRNGQADVADRIEKSRRQPKEDVKPQSHDDSNSQTDNSNSQSDSDDSDDEYPVSHELVLQTHDRPVTTIALDPSGSRMITGSVDCTLKFHDFASLTPNTLHAFKSVDPNTSKLNAMAESHPIHYAAFNPHSPSQMLVLSATSQAKIFSRDGEEIREFVKGDMYLRDLHNTKGHTSEITSGCWHPTNRDLFVTAAIDSTLRVWDINKPLKQRDVIVHKSRAAGSAGRSRMTAVAWGSPQHGANSLLVAAALDGTLSIWDGNGNYTRPAAEVREAHQNNTWTSSLAISGDGRTFVSKGGDHLIKLWDTRKFKQPISAVQHRSIADQYQTSNLCYSPDSSSILTGSEDGKLHILNPATLRPELVTPVSPNSPLISVTWHEKLNQIITGSADASVHVLYDPKNSVKGAALIMSKAPKRRHIDDDTNLTTDASQGVSGDAALGAQAGFAKRHPVSGVTVSGRAKDPRRPHIPAVTPFAKTQPDERHIKENIPLSSMRDEDPREALLKYADKAKNDPMFTNAWKTTQPKTLYADLSDEEPPEKKRR